MHTMSSKNDEFMSLPMPNTLSDMEMTDKKPEYIMKNNTGW